MNAGVLPHTTAVASQYIVRTLGHNYLVEAVLQAKSVAWYDPLVCVQLPCSTYQPIRCQTQRSNVTAVGNFEIWTGILLVQHYLRSCVRNILVSKPCFILAVHCYKKLEQNTSLCDRVESCRRRESAQNRELKNDACSSID